MTTIDPSSLAFTELPLPDDDPIEVARYFENLTHDGGTSGLGAAISVGTTDLPQLANNLGALVEDPRVRLAEAIVKMGRLEPDWDGNGAPAPDEGAIATALRFLSLVPSTLQVPAVAPATDNGITFEWDLKKLRAVHCIARADRIEVHAFDAEATYASLCLAPLKAAAVATAIVSEWQVSESVTG